VTKRRPPTRSKAASAPAQGPRAPTYDDILAIARLIESGSRFSEFRLRSGDIEIEVRRSQEAEGTPPAPAVATVVPEKADAPSQAEALDLPAGTRVVRSPMVGTFYRAPGPSEPPFVEKGSRVAPDTIVCIIEVMKLMNSVVAGDSGVVTHIFVDNAQPVEYGQPLLAIRPAP
jgi:acetyl-CoA carboxylase biotin carboxyl carrier protein